MINLRLITSIDVSQDKRTILFSRRGGWVSWDFETEKEQKEYYNKIKECHAQNISKIIKFE